MQDCTCESSTCNSAPAQQQVHFHQREPCSLQRALTPAFRRGLQDGSPEERQISKSWFFPKDFGITLSLALLCWNGCWHCSVSWCLQLSPWASSCAILKPLGPGTWKLGRHLFTSEAHLKGKETTQVTSNTVSGRLLTSLLGYWSLYYGLYGPKLMRFGLPLVCNIC